MLTRCFSACFPARARQPAAAAPRLPEGVVADASASSQLTAPDIAADSVATSAFQSVVNSPVPQGYNPFEAFTSPAPGPSVANRNPFAAPPPRQMTIREVFEREGIPQRLHWVWLGRPMARTDLNNICGHKRLLPGAEATIWTNSPKAVLHANGSANAESVRRRLHALGIRIGTIQTLLDRARAEALPVRDLESGIARESHGGRHNFASAGDIVRFLALDGGGLYLDTDVKPHDTEATALVSQSGNCLRQDLYLPDARRGTAGFNTVSSAIIAAPERSPVVRRVLRTLAKTYRTNPQTWDAKRGLPGEVLDGPEPSLLNNRMGYTIRLTGPALVRNTVVEHLREVLGIAAGSTGFGDLVSLNSALERMTTAIPRALITPAKPDGSGRSWAEPTRVTWDDS